MNVRVRAGVFVYREMKPQFHPCQCHLTPGAVLLGTDKTGTKTAVALKVAAETAAAAEAPREKASAENALPKEAVAATKATPAAEELGEKVSAENALPKEAATATNAVPEISALETAAADNATAATAVGAAGGFPLSIAMVSRVLPYIGACLCVHVCMYASVRTHMCVYVRVCHLRSRACACMYVCAYVCVCVCVCVCTYSCA